MVTETIQGRKLFKGGNYSRLETTYSRAETICGNTVVIKICGDNSDEIKCAPLPPFSVQSCSIISGPGRIGSKCIFPFKYEGVTYRGCPVKKGVNERWCPTSVDSNGNFRSESVGVCSESCPNYDYTGKEWFQLMLD